MKSLKYPLPNGEKHLQLVWEDTLENMPTLVFLHDSLGCIQLWRDFPARLAQKMACNYLIYDRLGYGASSANPAMQKRSVNYLEQEADILLKLLQDLDVPNPILVGHSDGGSIALIAAAKSSNIKAIITEGAHIFVEEITLHGIREAVKLYQNTNLAAKLEKYHPKKVEDVFRAWTATWLSPAYRSWNIEHFLAQIQCPALIIQGTNDEYGSIKQVEETVRQLSGDAQMCLLDQIGHSPHKENPDLVLDKVFAFLEQLRNYFGISYKND